MLSTPVVCSLVCTLWYDVTLIKECLLVRVWTSLYTAEVVSREVEEVKLAQDVKCRCDLDVGIDSCQGIIRTYLLPRGVRLKLHYLYILITVMNKYVHDLQTATPTSQYLHLHH